MSHTVRLSTRTWIVIIALLVALLGVLTFLFSGSRSNSAGTASVSVDGAVYRVIDLTTLNDVVEFTIETQSGTNTIQAKRGAIRMLSASCPDQTCVKQGWLTGGVTPIVCLPHGIVIELKGAATDSNDLDAISG